jgi:hypothetical protein
MQNDRNLVLPVDVTGYGDDHRLFIVKLDQATGAVPQSRHGRRG